MVRDTNDQCENRFDESYYAKVIVCAADLNAADLLDFPYAVLGARAKIVAISLPVYSSLSHSAITRLCRNLTNIHA